jgi:hypothetical protein
MRQPKPFYRSQPRSFYVQLDGRQINLGPDEAERTDVDIYLGPERTNRSSTVNQAATPDKADAATVQQLLKRYLRWQDGQAKLTRCSAAHQLAGGLSRKFGMRLAMTTSP